MPTPIDNTQPSLALNPMIGTQGYFPIRDGGSGYASYLLGQIHFFTMDGQDISGVGDLTGSQIPIAQNTALFSILGTTFGGNGQTTFALPDFEGLANVSEGQGPGLSYHSLGELFGQDSLTLISQQLPVGFGGTGQPVSNQQATTTINWCINAYGTWPSTGAANMIGGVAAFAGNFTPNGAIPCDGRLLAISEYTTLFAVLGTTYGGDGQTTFAVPDLRGRSIIGAGQGPDGHSYEVGEVVGSETLTIGNAQMPGSVGGGGGSLDNRAPGLVLQALVATEGLYNAMDQEVPTLGEVYFFAGTMLPDGMAPAQGQLLPISQNTALFSLLGTTYGGDGQTTFALPNLAGRTPVGDGFSYQLGETYGDTTFDVVFNALPDMTIVGNAADEALTGANGNDSLSGGDGNDGVRGNDGNDSLTGGNGRDTLTGGNGSDLIDGGAGQDRATYEAAAAGVTIDLLLSGVQNTGGGGADTLASIENVLGSGHDDILRGTDDRNWLSGGNGADLLDGRDGNDTLMGGAGNDTLLGGAGNDSLNGGSGTDVADYSGATASVTVDLRIKPAQDTGGAGSDTLHLIENVIGSTYNDLISGNLYANTLSGGDGNDTLYGQGGTDVLFGGNGNDQVTGGAGNDVLHSGLGIDTMGGGIGADIYVFDTAAAAGNEDLVNGFISGEDVIELSLAVFAGLAGFGAGPLDPGELVPGTSAAAPGDRLIYDGASGTLYYDVDGVGGVDQVVIATFSNFVALSASDIMLV